MMMTTIPETLSSFTDIQNHKSHNSAPRINHSTSAVNVSRVRITCEADNCRIPKYPSKKGISVPFVSSSESCPSTAKVNFSEKLNTFINIEKSDIENMWRNGNYCESSLTTEEKSFGFNAIRTAHGGILKFPVDYLGSVPVEGNTTSLQDLQVPLRNLYLAFLSGKNSTEGHLAITSDGIRFEAQKMRLVNSFSTIAVWAAIKFVAKGEPIPTDCAFMPLISDPEGQDKGRLFGKMDPELSRSYLNCLAGSSKNNFKNPPLFACVMRESSSQPDCHVFACRCAEDAIVVAANLYQSLVDKIRSSTKGGESGYGSLTRTTPSAAQSSPNRSSSSELSDGVHTNDGCGGCSNGISGNVSCPSSSTSGAGDKKGHRNRVVFSDSESVVPIRPPRKKKKSLPEFSNLKRYNSDDSILLKLPNRRKQSFKGKANNNHPNKVKKRVQISTPEEETSSADSLNESIDQVLDRIVNPGGMSFNDLKPSYQDLILKIALTLTQDQLYQKSKQAMKNQKKYFIQKKSKTHCSCGEASDDNSQFLNHLMKSFSKITSGKSNSPTKRLGNNKSSAPNIFPHKPSSHLLPTPKKVILKKPKEEVDPFMSFCSGCSCNQCSEKCYCSLPTKQPIKLNGVPTPTGSTTATIAASSPCELLKSRGYDSCTDSADCAESEKCYCSLQRVKSNGLKVYNINLDTETSDTDTNSYDLEPFNKQKEICSSSNTKTMSARSVEILSYHPSKRLSYCFSPSAPHIQTANALVNFEDSLNSQASNARSSAKSMGKHKTSCYVSQKILDNNSDAKSRHQRDKVLLITGSTPSTRVVYKDSNKNYNPNRMEIGEGKRSRSGMHRNLIDIIEDECNNENHEQLDEDREETDDNTGTAKEKLLSMKKTAEIAATFANLKLNQTTNVVQDLMLENFDSIQNTEDSTASLDFEASLGYLP